MDWIYILLISHWLSDFALQSDRVAKGKSKSLQILIEHVTIYSSSMAVLSMLIFYNVNNLLGNLNATVATILFFILTFTTHFITDYITSKITSTLWEAGDTHNFFVVIGLDQLIHITTLIITVRFILNL